MATKDTIFEATSGGLDIILKLYPDAEESVVKPNRKFKIRNEKTASASMKEFDGVWYVKDFGGDAVGRNAIDCWMKEHGCDFPQAIKQICLMFDISTDDKAKPRGPRYRKEKAPEGMKPGIYTHEANRTIPTEADLKVLGKRVKMESFKDLGWHKLERYEVVKEDGTMHVFECDEGYPIFEIVFDGFTKIYQPLNPDKAYRFMYTGKRPKDFICGLDQLKVQYELNEMKLQDDEEQKNPDPKVDEVIICSGETDALNVHSLGYEVVWMNSESQVMTFWQFNELRKLSKKQFYLGDIDATGKRQAFAWGMAHLDLRIIKLPESLLRRRDWRGNPCKDVRDYLKYYSPHDFRLLLNLAYPYKFWDDHVKRDKEGKYEAVGYRFNLAYALNFLAASGFGQIKHPNAKTGYQYVRIENKVVAEVRIQEIKAFMKEFVESRRMHVDIINMVMRTRDMSETAMTNLDIREVTFSRSGRDYQHFFFQEQIWKITAAGIDEVDPEAVPGHIWEEQIITPRVKEGEFKPAIDQDYFTVTRDAETGQYDIEIHVEDNPFFQFLINASRMYWKREFESAGLEGEEIYQPLEKLKELDLHRIDGDRLSDKERQEQKLHLINKLHVLGHLLHSHKDPSRPWAVWAMDNRISEISESHGRSGKSITFQALRQMLKSEYENGRNLDLTKKPFLFENVSEYTDYILVDDANYMIDLNFFYSWITGDMPINPKNARSYTIPFEKSPKLAFTSNYAPRQRDSSTMGRLYFTVYSDYYHDISDHHVRPRSPLDDLGLRLFEDFNTDQWNKFFNLMAQCVKLYMSFGKINPPMENVEKRGHLNVMGDAFYHWANDYFLPKVNSPSIDRGAAVFIPRKEALDTYTEYNKRDKAITMQRFSKKVDAWAAFHGFQVNPESVQQTSGRVFTKINGEKVECFYLEGNVSNNEYEGLPFMDEPF